MQIVALEHAGGVVALEPQPFGIEVHLQRLLREYPRLLLAPVGDYQDRSIWTIGYEVGTEAGSLDLLCLDSTGEVWVVETKLAKNPEAKKQVVGQVLGYASSISAWTVDRLQAVAQDYLKKPLIEHLAEAVGMAGAERIVESAVEKMKLGDLTAVVVLDDLPKVLQGLIEFVNGHSSFDLLALTVTLFEHKGTRLVVPTIIGATANKGVSATGQDQETLDGLMDNASPDFKDVVTRLENWGEGRGYRWRPILKSRDLLTVDGEFVVRLLPKWNSIDVWLASLIEAGMTDEVEAIRSRLFDITKRPVPKVNPNVKAVEALANWDEFISILEEYVTLRQHATTLLSGLRPSR